VKIVLKDATKSEFSILCGNAYGRLGGLPKLNMTTLNSILPVRAFNIHILVRPNHSTAHAICFPSDGSVEVANVLPTVGNDRCPQGTFLGPREA
jgi:hypothetical protein